MKKLLVLALAVMLTLSLAACGEKDAYELYLEAEKKMASVSSMEADIEMDISMNMAGFSIDMSMGGTMKEVIRSETDMDLEMTLAMNMLGQNIDMIMYYKDGWMYQDAMGMKTKTKLDVDAVLEQAMVSNVALRKEMVESATITDENGGKRLDFVLKDEFMQEMLNSVTDSMLDSMGMDDMDFSVTNMSYSMLLDKDNMMKNYTMSFDANMEIEGMAVEMSAEMFMDIVSVDSVDAIDFPSDLDSYIEM